MEYSKLEDKSESPEVKAGWFSKLFFTWIIPLYRKIISNGTLTVTDLFKNLECNDSEKLGNVLEHNWRKELTKAHYYKRNPKLLCVLVKTFLWDYMIFGVLLFIQNVILRCAQPLVLAHFISLFAEDQDEENVKMEMWISASILVGISGIVVFMTHHQANGQLLIGMRLRVAISSLIYRKTSRLSKAALSTTPIGEIVNLLANDVSRFEVVMISLHYLWIMLVQIPLVTYLLWNQVGLSSLAGVGSVVLISIPMHHCIGKLAAELRMKVANKTDARVTLMSEVISGIQVIKMLAWEKPFQTLVNLARRREICALTSASYLRGLALSCVVFIGRTGLFLTITCHILSGNYLSADQVFSMAQFFNILQLTMTVFYPIAMTQGREALVSIKRIQKFLLLNEVEDCTYQALYEGVLVENVHAYWNYDKVLDSISVSVPSGSLCAVIGTVGSGKSSFLNLLLGELKPLVGDVRVGGTISYASQEPWLFASTVRNNILFGQPFDKQLYKRIVKICALDKDFEELPQGDLTMAGERGSSLSGGQRARVNLARAVYRTADVYLLDDPLSAVDSHVAKHLFDACIMKYLRGRTRILVTHQLQYLKKADVIMVFKEGRIEAKGTYEEVSKQIPNFVDMMMAEDKSEEKPEQTIDLLTSHDLSKSIVVENDQVNLSVEQSNEQGSAPFKEYIKAADSPCLIVVLLVMLFLAQIVCSASDFWLTYWTKNQAPLDETLEIEDADSVHKEGIDSYMAVYIYSGLMCAVIAVTLFRSTLFFKIAMNASTNLHNHMFAAMLQAPMQFFNTNPCGRILNRFSKDLGAVDELLPMYLLQALQITLVMCGALVMVLISNYMMAINLIIVGCAFWKIRKWFIDCARHTKRLENMLKSPVFSHVNSTLLGLTTIRAFGAGQMLNREFDSLQNTHTSAFTLCITNSVSFGLWLDLLCVYFIGATVFAFVIFNATEEFNGSYVGLAISQALVLTGMVQFGIRQTADAINQLMSVERILQYSKLDKEDETWKLTIKDYPPKPWPSFGGIEFCNFHLRYAVDQEPVLKNLNFAIKPGERIGVVGRTGAGKSSLIAALFRLAQNEGQCRIDGIDIKHVALEKLRKNISIIPQEPVLFSDSLRFNLDPSNEFTDEQLWQALENVQLKDKFNCLNEEVVNGGKNFSVGQRQLLCLARAMLRNNKIIIMDEATANIDAKTDNIIHDLIRESFKNCTVITIAHRLQTIMDSNRVMVMDNGEIMEFDTPYRLLQKPDTRFHGMAHATGDESGAFLEHLALLSFLDQYEAPLGYYFL